MGALCKTPQYRSMSICRSKCGALNCRAPNYEVLHYRLHNVELYIAEFHILVGSLYSFTLFTNPLIYWSYLEVIRCMLTAGTLCLAKLTECSSDSLFKFLDWLCSFKTANLRPIARENLAESIFIGQILVIHQRSVTFETVPHCVRP